MESNIDRLKRLTDKIVSYEVIRRENLKRLKELFFRFELDKKIENFEDIFEFKAMNLSGVSLNESDFCKIKEKKYIQIIAISKVKNRMKNINLKYFGRAEKIEKDLLVNIVEFVVRWRLEKSYLNMDNYKKLLEKLKG